MRQTVYVETSVISHLTARATNDVIQRGYQKMTRGWWRNRRADFDLYISQFVLDEAAAGDPKAAATFAALRGIDSLLISTDVPVLADRLLVRGALPVKARLDALHLAVATIHGMDYLMTWNCKHLANAVLWSTIKMVCEAEGYKSPTICTPHELLGRHP